MAQRTARKGKRTGTRRSAVPPTAGSFGQLMSKLTGASAKLSKSRRRVRGW